MNSLKQKLEQISYTKLVAIICLLAAILATWVNYIQHGWLNNDSILYFEAAKLFAAGQWKAGFELFQWPLYSLLIAGFHATTSIDIHTSAQVLSVLFFTLACYFFVKAVIVSGGDKLTVVAAALLLFSSVYITGDVLPMLLRDQGFWAFYLMSIYWVMCYLQDKTLKSATIWQLSAIAAMLFRIEAVTFLVLGSLVLFTETDLHIKARFTDWLRASYLLIIGAITLTTTLAFNFIKIDELGRLQEAIGIFERFYGKIMTALISKAELIGTNVLGSYLDDYAMFMLLAGLLGIVVIKALNVLGYIPALLLILDAKKLKQKVSSRSLTVLVWYSGLAVLNMIVIILSVYVLSGRYVVAFALPLLVLASFSLAALFNDDLLERFSTSIRKLLLYGVLVVVSLSMIKIVLPESPEHYYEKNAVTWLQEHAKGNNNTFYATAITRHYANAPYLGQDIDDWFATEKAIENGSIHNYDYLVISINTKKPEQLTLLNKLQHHALIKEFPSLKGKKKVLIYAKQNLQKP